MADAMRKAVRLIVEGRISTLGHFIKMSRFDKTLEGLRKDSVLHGKTCPDI
jgi:hypothetical protein